MVKFQRRWIWLKIPALISTATTPPNLTRMTSQFQISSVKIYCVFREAHVVNV